MSDATTLEPAPERRGASEPPLELLIACLRDEPGGSLSRAGERVVGPGVFGRGEGDGSDVRASVSPPLSSPHLSRRHLRITRAGVTRLNVENLGRAPMRVCGRATAQATVTAGDVVELGDVAVLIAAPWVEPAHDGRPDGLVGHSPAMLTLLERIAFTARQRGHVLVLGPSGAGKERVAQALHRQGQRTGRLVARNAATIPASLMDVELFGHVKNYPNPGMAERGGLVGEADGGTLFLDELGEIDESMQAHLLRLLDSGEYQRLGDPRTRTADLRVIGATNRAEDELKPDLRARFRHVLRVPPLSERRADIPLLLQHLALLAFTESPELRERFAPHGGPEVSPAFMAALLTAPLPLQVRELDALLWESLAESPGQRLELPPSLRDASSQSQGLSREWDEVSREALVAAMEEHGGSPERVWRALGLRNRYVLRRLLKKWDLDG